MLISLRTPKENFFIFGESFEKILLVYLDIAKFILGLAAGGIVLVIGSSTFGQSKALPSGYASPLFLLAMSILYGIVFMPFLALNYESVSNRTSEYTRWQYIWNRALGYSSLACFCIGYGWLIFGAVRA